MNEAEAREREVAYLSECWKAAGVTALFWFVAILVVCGPFLLWLVLA